MPRRDKILSTEYFDRKAGLEDGSIEKLAEVYDSSTSQAVEVLAGILDPMREPSAFAWGLLGMAYAAKRPGNREKRLLSVIRRNFRDASTELRNRTLAEIVPQLAEAMPSSSSYAKKLKKITEAGQTLTKKKEVKDLLSKIEATNSKTIEKWKYSYNNYYLVRDMWSGYLEFLFGYPLRYRPHSEKIAIAHRGIVDFLHFVKTGRIKPNGQIAANINEKRPQTAHIKLG
jgi:hypothetical protein